MWGQCGVNAEEQTVSLFSFYSRKKRKEFQYSLSPLEIGDIYQKFLFNLSEVENILSDFSLSSPKCSKAISGAGLEISDRYEQRFVVQIIATKEKQIW